VVTIPVVGRTDARGSLTIPVPGGESWPWHLLVTAEGFLPELRRIDGPGKHRFVLRLGSSLVVEVVLPDGTPVADCALAVSGAALPDPEDCVRLASRPEAALSIEARTAVHVVRTDPQGIARVSGLSPGRVYIEVVPLELLARKQEPALIEVPAHDRVRITVDQVYAAALRTPGDQVRDAFLPVLPGTKVDVLAGPRINAINRVGKERVGGGVCIALFKKTDLPEADFLAWDADGVAIMERRGRVPFRVRPIRFADLDRAPVLELPDQEERVGEVAIIATDREQAPVLAMIADGLVTLTGASPECVGQTVTLNGHDAARLVAGTYRCGEALGAFSSRVEYPAEVVVVPRGRADVPVRLREIVAPVRIWLVDGSGTSHDRGQWAFEHQGRRLRFTGMAVRRFEETTHWLPAGRWTVRARPTVRSEWTSEEFEIPFRWTTEPVEVFLQAN
jgi:hypothetical protein